MKLNISPLFAGIAAISMLAPATITLAAAVPAIIAQQNQQDNPLGLTPAQQAQLQQIRKDTLEQMGRVVTQAQQQRFLTARKQGKDEKAAIAAMELTANQQQQISQILQAARQRSLRVFTPEQIEKIREIQSKRQQQ